MAAHAGCSDCACQGGRSEPDLAHRAGERRSKRARRGSAQVRLGAGNSLWELKLRLVEALGVHPGNALVHVLRDGRWARLERDDASLAGARPRPWPQYDAESTSPSCDMSAAGTLACAAALHGCYQRGIEVQACVCLGARKSRIRAATWDVAMQP